MNELKSSNKNTNLGTHIVTTLKERIMRWEYPPGHRFTEEELCQEFGVSRSPIREALRALTVSGFVEKMPHRGHKVRQLDIHQIDELYEVRLALELYVVECLAQRHMQTEQTEALKQTWTRVLGECRESEELARMDEVFHETLTQAMGNGTLLQQLRTINERLFILRMIDFTIPERVTNTSKQHVAILEQIAAGDVAGAREAMRKNIDDGRNNVETAIKGALAKAYLR